MKEIYKTSKISSSVRAWSGTWEQLVQEMGTESEIILWQHHGISRGSLQDNLNIDWLIGQPHDKPDAPEHFKELRIFNTQKEIFCWALDKNSIFNGRIRNDQPSKDDGKVWMAFDIAQVLRGNMVIEKYNSGKKEKILTRNYVGFNAFHIAGIVDQRFCTPQTEKNHE